MARLAAAAAVTRKLEPSVGLARCDRYFKKAVFHNNNNNNHKQDDCTVKATAL